MDEIFLRYSKIGVDPPSVEIPTFAGGAQFTLNCQTGFNRSLLETREVCGCFHCGRRFPTLLVTEWMLEEGEEDTGVCPYCGVDALIVGDAEHPLSTALLTMLYEYWFQEERDERRHSATDVPHFADLDDYLRQGVPFRWTMHGGRCIVAEVGVFKVGQWDGPEEYDDDGYPLHVFGRLGDVEPGGVWHVRGPFDADGAYVGFELVGDDGSVVPFEPWGDWDRDVVAKLVDKHGTSLRGVFKSPSFDRMQLYIDEIPAECD